jgi:proline iminopeptidase
MLSRPADPKDPESVIDHLVEMFGVIGSPGYPANKAELRQRVGRSVRRAYDPGGTARQLLAVIVSGDRRKQLRTIKAPTLVIHGAEDPLVPLAAGRDTARQIPGARLLVIEGMGHDLPDALLPRLVAAIAEHCGRAEQ